MQLLYSISTSPGSDISTLQARAREPVCAISLGARELEPRFENKCATSLQEIMRREYRLTLNFDLHCKTIRALYIY